MADSAADAPPPSSPAPAAPSASVSSAGFLDRLSDTQVSLLVVLGALLVYVPLAGTYGLWDPWETHYGEVARQMTKRGDFISLWWPGSPRDRAEFWSKPVFTFWLMSAGMHLFRVGLPGGDPGEMALTWRGEWALRLPMCLMGALAIWAVYLLVARLVGRRAGLLSALVLATSPMFFLIARQAMTDMPFVGPMTMALALGALALLDDRDEELPRRGRGWWSWPHDRAFYATLAVFALLALPQLVVDSSQLKVQVRFGGRDVLMYGAIYMIPYYVGFAAFVWLAARARYRAPLYLSIAAMLCGAATLAKGFAGAGLPVIVFVTFLAFTWNWRRLRRAQLLPAIPVSLVAYAVVAVPWHHAMWLRHGAPWWDELFGDNHWRRMVLGRHGDRGTFEYFLRELGYGALPWIALAPAALAVLVLRRPDDPGRRGAYQLGAIWFVAAYGVVSMSMTKFHHYILPALPGLAIVLGCFLDDLWKTRGRALGLLLALVGVPILALIVRDLTAAKNAAQLFLWLFSYDYVHSPSGRPWPPELDFRAPLYVFGGLFAAALLALAWPRVRRGAIVGLGAVAIAFTLFVLNVYMRKIAPHWSQKHTLAAYYKNRASPDEKLVAYMMYWRGETFYTKNEIYEGEPDERTVFDSDGADDRLRDWLARNRGKRVFFMYERGREARLRGMLPGDAGTTWTVVESSNNKFNLARAEL